MSLVSLIAEGILYAEGLRKLEEPAQEPIGPLFWGKMEIIDSNQHKDENIPQDELSSRNRFDKQ